MNAKIKRTHIPFQFNVPHRDQLKWAMFLILKSGELEHFGDYTTRKAAEAEAKEFNLKVV